MNTFEYKGFDHAGRAARGLVEAQDLKDAREKLAALSVLPEKVEPAGAARASALGDRRLRTEVRAMLYREIGALLRAGLPLTEALEVLIQSPELGVSRATLAGIRDRVREGATMADALAAAGRQVTAFEQAVVQSGERSGRLGEVFERLAAFLEEQAQVSARMQTALIYPAIVLVLALVIVVMMLGFLVPALGRMLEEARMPLPWLTRAMLAIGRWVLPALAPLALAALAGIAWWRARLAADERWRRRRDRFLFRVPVWGEAYGALVNLRFARTLALLLRGGVTLVEGIGLAGRATGNAWTLDLCGALAEQVRHGQKFSDALRVTPPLNTSLPAWVRAGEVSGQLDVMLESAATRYQQQWDRRMARLLSLLEPALILVVGVFVLLVALSILLPVLRMNRLLH